MDVRRYLQSFTRTSKITKASGVALVLVATALAVTSFAACAGGSDGSESGSDQLTGGRNTPLPYRPNRNLM